MPKGWTLLGAGSYNKAYLSEDKKSVLKIPKNSADETDTPERAVRLWNTINRHLPPPARIEVTDEGVGWVCPFVEGEQANDDEMSDAVINIFNDTGRILVDATATKNFIKTPPPNSAVVCVDVGLALQLEKREDIFFKREIRRKSVISLDDWQRREHSYTKFFDHCSITNPKTVETVKALLFIKHNRPDIYDVNFLKDQPDLRAKLATAYISQSINGMFDRDSRRNTKQAIKKLEEISPAAKRDQEIKCGKGILDEQHPITLDNIKLSLNVELTRYIESRGKFDIQGTFHSSLITKLFRDEVLTSKKISTVQNLINNIYKANSLDEIIKALKEMQTDDLTTGKITHGYERAIGKCLLITEAVKDNLTPQFTETINI